MTILGTLIMIGLLVGGYRAHKRERAYQHQLHWVTNTQLDRLREWADAGDAEAEKVFNDVLDYRAKLR